MPDELRTVLGNLQKKKFSDLCSVRVRSFDAKFWMANSPVRIFVGEVWVRSFLAKFPAKFACEVSRENHAKFQMPRRAATKTSPKICV